MQSIKPSCGSKPSRNCSTSGHRPRAARARRLPTLAPAELAAAVQSFVCAAGVLPHLGPGIAQISESERAQMCQYVDMVDAWVAGARRTLATVIISGEA